ncbi:hypothetical protein CU663_31215 [Pseudomonas syringae pv. actinidifoliorum]|nr:hypothetical protein [Pseudomonas syringae pv. actinidifoliorum]
MQITQGQRIPLSTLIQGNDLTLSIVIKSAHVIDYVCFGVDANGKLSDDKIIKLVRDNFDLRPYAITTMLDLLHPMYQATAAYGHFGRTPVEMTVGDDTFTAFTWEKTDRADALRAAAGL